MDNIVWQLPVKQSNSTCTDWIHPKAKYHTYINDVSLCGKYSQCTSYFETDGDNFKVLPIATKEFNP
ncbi:hypothetical protein DJ87_5251 [Bacillus cereus]|nr:hypothetical protein DJ87_5251 [Bacillus cereus]